MAGTRGDRDLPKSITIGLGENWEGKPIEATLERATSRRGRPYYKLVAQELNLPDGLDQAVSYDGVEVDMGDDQTSEAGNPYRRGELGIEVAGTPCLLKVTIVEGKKPYWVSLLVNIRSSSAPTTSRDGTVQGGTISGL